jgi:hypothetical protein
MHLALIYIYECYFKRFLNIKEKRKINVIFIKLILFLIELILLNK